MTTRYLLPLVLLCVAAAPATQPLPARLGVNIHFTRPQPGEIKMMADAGINTIRMDFAWSGTEREKGKYDFTAYDGLIAALEEHHIGAVFILDYANKLYDDGLSPHTDAGREAFAKWAAAAVAHFKGRNIIWEMYNEPNIQFWKPKPNVEDYAKLAIATGKAIRASDPQAKYIGPASSTIDLPFLEACFKAGCLEYWDAVSVHPYRQSEPETVAKEYRELRHLIAKYAPKNKQIPIYSGEWGYSAAWSKYDEEKQALYLPRQWLTNIMNDVPLSIWYDWHDDGRDPKEPEHHFGTVQNEKNKEGPEPWKAKAAYLAMKTFSEQLRGFEFNKRLAAGDPDSDFVLLFARKDPAGKLIEAKLAVWTTAARHDVRIMGIAEKCTVVDHVGRRIPPLNPPSRSDDAALFATLDSSVQYLTPEKLNDAVRVAVACNRVPLEIVTPFQPRIEYAFSFCNPLDRPVVARWDPHTGGDVTIGRGASQYVRMEPALSRHEQLSRRRISFEVAGTGTVDQWLTIFITNPLRVEVLGTVRQRLVLQVEDVAGEGATAVIEAAAGGQPPLHESVSIARGARVAVVYTKLEFHLRDGQPMHAVVEDPAGAQPTNRKSVGLTFLDDFSKLEYKVVADGDKKVKSEQNLALASPLAGPPATAIGVLQLSYRFTPGHKFIQIMPTKEELRALPGKPRELRLWVFGDGSGHLARCRVVDSTGQVFQPNGTKISWTGWKLVTFPLGGSDNGHWGGKNDGEVHYPLKLDTLFLLDNASKQASEGKIYLASPMTVE